MKSGDLIEHSLRNIFLEKSDTAPGGETIPRPFCKSSKIEHIPGSISISGFI